MEFLGWGSVECELLQWERGGGVVEFLGWGSVECELLQWEERGVMEFWVGEVWSVSCCSGKGGGGLWSFWVGEVWSVSCCSGKGGVVEFLGWGSLECELLQWEVDRSVIGLLGWVEVVRFVGLSHCWVVGVSGC